MLFVALNSWSWPTGMMTRVVLELTQIIHVNFTFTRVKSPSSVTDCQEVMLTTEIARLLDFVITALSPWVM